MQYDDGFTLSASDLANFLACRHCTQLERTAALGRVQRPVQYGARLQALIERGLQHEADYVAHLRGQGRGVVELGHDHTTRDAGGTLRMMRSGPDVIVQAGLADGRWRGLADLLIRVERPSELGDFSYEVADTKLSHETRAGTILQLSLYSDLVGRLQGRAPERMHVIKPGDPFEPESFRVAAYRAYFRLVCRQLEEAVDRGDAATYPYPVGHCQICRWWQHCEGRRRADDHLSLVAGLRTSHVLELEGQGIVTLESFAERDTALAEAPRRGSRETYEVAQGQARVQLEGRRRAEPTWTLRAPEPERGFLRLPEPSQGDIFLDFEGDPHVPGGGLEYLTGYAWIDESGDVNYTGLWAHSAGEERRAFERFIDFVGERMRRYPDLHIYHFATYEPAALKRLMGRYGTRETEMDALLRGGRFVDLHAVTRQALQASVERYSLKNLEPFAEFERTLDLRAASLALRRVEYALEMGRLDRLAADDVRAVEAYNKDDCLATIALRDWLEARRSECMEEHGAFGRPDPRDGAASERVEAVSEEVRQVHEALVAGLPDDRMTWSGEQRARWLLAHLLEYFRREARCAWWEFFRLCDLEDEALLDERKGLAGLQFVEREDDPRGCPIDLYTFPPQECGLRVGNPLHMDAGPEVGSVSEIDDTRGLIRIKKRRATAEVHPPRVVVNECVGPGAMPGTLLALARDILANGFEGTRFTAARDLLLHAPPRRHDDAPLRLPGEDLLTAARRIAPQLDGSVLALQGPPGAGKTYVGARTIVELVRRGKRVGITAVGHKVIGKLLGDVEVAAAERDMTITVGHLCSDRTKLDEAEQDRRIGGEAVDEVLSAGGVVGATAWHWSREQSEGALDYLFVDEAGQMSLAMALAASRATANLVLLGDPQQLEQPQRGAHPEGAEVAALQHILQGCATMPPERGLFLDETWRLSPALCTFTSELFYEGRLHPRAGNERQGLIGETPFLGQGLFHVASRHTGNQNVAREEVAQVRRIFEHLTDGSLAWVDRDGSRRRVERDDVLIVAPFNAQVAEIGRALSADARVGTVDKFQGQEAAVVIYSMTSSSAEDAPRGLSFLYDLHRLNVATSRAKCAVILIATDALFAPGCASPEQMRLANAVCRYAELARRVPEFEA